MPKTAQPTAVAPILKGLTQGLGLEKGIALLLLEQRWKEVVGPQVSAHTHPLEIRFGALAVMVDSAAWTHELSFLKKELIEKINRAIGNSWIETLHFKIGPLPPRASFSSDRPPRPTEEDPEEIALLDQQLQLIADPDLKRIIRGAMKSHLRKGSL
ncbi:MAG TPA: DUF721 domain-containing protein [Candidatus Manganitrophaceae bacterium]|nr:DUF721 domain-containing protein [Candidatus Manganitrophaceae bacterium]